MQRFISTKSPKIRGEKIRYFSSVNFKIDKDITLARTPPGSFYIQDSSSFSAQCTTIFNDTWHYSPEILLAKNPGDALPFSTLSNSPFSEPLLAVKDVDNIMRVFSNVCTHRGKILIEGTSPTSIISNNGKVSIKCGYHGRRFSGNGRCVGAPGFDSINNTVDDLPQASVHIVKGILPFVSLGPNKNNSFETIFGDLFDRLSFLPLQDLRLDSTGTKSFEVKCHWSLYIENYLEGLHVPFVHPSLNNALTMSAYTTELFQNSSLQIGPATNSDTDNVLLPMSNTTTNTSDRIVAYYAWLFPNMMLNFYHWGCSINVVVPLGPSLTRIDYTRLLWGNNTLSSTSTSTRQSAGDNLDIVEQEDDAVVESVQKGIGARLYTRGRYSPKWELGTHHFHRLLTSKL